MSTANFVLDILIYAGAGAVIAVGAYVLARFFKGEAKKRKNNKK